MAKVFPGRLVPSGVILLCLVASAIGAYSQTLTNDPPSYGPFNGTFLPDGDGLKKPLVKDDSVLRADSPWSPGPPNTPSPAFTPSS